MDDETFEPFQITSVWQSPSTYITLATYIIPDINLAVGRDVGDLVLALANLAPLVATAILLVGRVIAHNRVTAANLRLTELKVEVAKGYTPQDGEHETRLDALELRYAELEELIGDEHGAADHELDSDAVTQPVLVRA